MCSLITNILIDNIVVLYLYVLLHKHILALAHTICSYMSSQIVYRTKTLGDNILDDEEFEGEIPESFSLNLSVQDIAVVVSTSSATVFITDDESDEGMSVIDWSFGANNRMCQ